LKPLETCGLLAGSFDSEAECALPRRLDALPLPGQYLASPPRLRQELIANGAKAAAASSESVGHLVVSEQRVPQGIDVNVPNAARMYDYYLGGDNNFPADREAAEKVLRVAPWARTTALENRAFLGRAVAWLVREAGIRQFVDIGTGLPTNRNVHQIAQAIAPAARVAYVDNDPVVLGHSRALLARVPHTATVRADLRQPAGIIGHPSLTALIDWTRPVALLLVAILHFIPDQDDPAGIVGQFRQVMAPGSHIVISHAHHDGDGDAVRQIISIYRSANAPMVLRTSEQVQAFFTGFVLVEPGLVPLQQWRPTQQPYSGEQVWAIGGAGRLKPRP
jgi:SAM-dependent methyltransferase